jgi:hypothetical protein
MVRLSRIALTFWDAIPQAGSVAAPRPTDTIGLR